MPHSHCVAQIKFAFKELELVCVPTSSFISSSSSSVPLVTSTL